MLVADRRDRAPQENRNVRIAVDVDVEGALNLFEQRVLKASEPRP
jgi:hypothetical protein